MTLETILVRATGIAVTLWVASYAIIAITDMFGRVSAAFG